MQNNRDRAIDATTAANTTALKKGEAVTRLLALAHLMSLNAQLVMAVMLSNNNIKNKSRNILNVFSSNA